MLNLYIAKYCKYKDKIETIYFLSLFLFLAKSPSVLVDMYNGVCAKNNGHSKNRNSEI